MCSLQEDSNKTSRVQAEVCTQQVIIDTCCNSALVIIFISVIMIIIVVTSVLANRDVTQYDQLLASSVCLSVRL